MSKENHFPHFFLLIHCLILNSLNYTCDLESDLRRYVKWTLSVCVRQLQTLNFFLKLLFEDNDALGVLMVS